VKHADRDTERHIALDEVDNLQLLMQASGAYLDLTNDNLGPEGFVLWVYFNVVAGMTASMPERFRKYASELEELDPNEFAPGIGPFIDVMAPHPEAAQP
jgi:hypothetical protein